MADKNSSLDRLISEVLAIEAEAAQEAGALGFMARVMVQATLPHKRTSESIFTRQNGDLTLMIRANPKTGLPYGSIPRLLLAWMTTEAVRTQSPRLVLGDNLSDFMSQLGLVPTGGRWGTITRLKDQTKRLLTASVSAIMDTEEQFAGKHFAIADTYHLWWRPVDMEQRPLWQSTVTLAQGFYEEITDRPVPVDLRVLAAIAKSPMALDLYVWLTYRLSYLKHPTTIPWDALQMQFGAGYRQDPQGRRDFKKNLIKALKKVSLVYASARFSPGESGLTLKPSPPHVRPIK